MGSSRQHTLVVSSALVAALLSGCVARQELVDVPGQHRGLRIGDEQQGVWTYFHPNGALRAQGEYVDDEQHGPWEYRYPPGKDANSPVEWQIQFDEGHLDGLYRHLYRGGQPVLEGSFDDDREQGLWSFYAPGGKLTEQGSFEDGKRSLRWVWQRPDGSLVAEGYFYDDQRVGPWSWYAADGSAMRRALPMPRDVRLVRDTWDGGGVRREGFLVDDERDGIWTSWHRSGGRRVVGHYDDGEADGAWTVFDPSGTPLAHGAMDDGKPVGEWLLMLGDEPRSVPAERLPAPLASDGSSGSPDLLSTRGIELAVGTWLGELLAPAAPATWPSSEGAAVPKELADLGATRPAIPVPPQPWRAREVSDFPAMLELYTKASSGGGAGRGRRGSDPYSGRQTASSRGNTSISEPLIGKPLPVEHLVTPDGEISIASLRGRKVAVVVMRGFDGEICIYCAAQTRALELNRAQFEAVGAEVVVVYPGDGDDLDTFLAAVRTMSDEGEDPSYAMAFDPAYELVSALRVEGAKAMPTTLLLDEQGIVRWAYVGQDKVDRPPVDRLVGLLKKLPGT